MSDNFIGNATLTDALLTHYTRPFSEYSDNKLTVNVTKEQHGSLKEIHKHLSGDVCAMAGGVEAIGHLLHGFDLENIGIDKPQLSGLGFCLAHLGKQIDSYRHLMVCVESDLRHSKIIKT